MWDLNDMNNVKKQKLRCARIHVRTSCTSISPRPQPLQPPLHALQTMVATIASFDDKSSSRFEKKKGGGIIRSCVKMSSAKERQIYV